MVQLPPPRLLRNRSRTWLHRDWLLQSPRLGQRRPRWAAWRAYVERRDEHRHITLGRNCEPGTISAMKPSSLRYHRPHSPTAAGPGSGKNHQPGETHSGKSSANRGSSIGHTSRSILLDRKAAAEAFQASRLSAAAGEQPALARGRRAR